MSVKSHEKGRPGPTHSVALDMTERAAGRAGSDLGRDRRPARRSILAGCMAGWRSGSLGRRKGAVGTHRHGRHGRVGAVAMVATQRPRQQGIQPGAEPRRGIPRGARAHHGGLAVLCKESLKHLSVLPLVRPSCVCSCEASPSPRRLRPTPETRLRDDFTTAPFTAQASLVVSCRGAGSLVGHVLDITGDRTTALECRVWSWRFWRLLEGTGGRREGQSLKFVVLQGCRSGGPRSCSPSQSASAAQDGASCSGGG